MEINYKRDLNHSHLILKTVKKIDMESYQIRLLTGNHLVGFLQCTPQMINGETLFYYEISGRQNIFNLYEHQKIKLVDLRLIFDCLIKKIEEMRSFLLPADGLRLNPEYIYLSADKEEVFFCYFPAEKKDIMESLRELAEYLLPKIDHTDQAAVMLGYNIYRCVREEGMCLEQIKQELYREHIMPAKAEFSLFEEDEDDFVEEMDKELVEESKKDTLKGLMLDKEELVHPAISTIIVAVAGILLFLYFFFINNTEFSWHIYVAAAVILLLLAGLSAGLYLFKAKPMKKSAASSKLKRH